MANFLETPPFPLCPSYGFQGGPELSVTVTVGGSGFELRNLNWAQARRSYVLSVGPRADLELEQLLEHFEAVEGKATGFRFKDPHDFRSCPPYAAPAFSDQVIGTGNASTTTFQLIKKRTSGAQTHSRAIKKPVPGTVLIGLDSTQQLSGWTVDTATGIVTFASPPGNGVLVKAGFDFDVPVRYDLDRLPIVILDQGASSCSFTMVELRL